MGRLTHIPVGRVNLGKLCWFGLEHQTAFAGLLE